MRHVSKTSANRRVLSSLLLLLALGTAHADPRDIAEPVRLLTPEEREARRVQHLADMDAWLRMLEGRFRIEGIMVDNRSLSEPGTGILTGSTTRFLARCANAAAYPPCEVQTRIYIPQGAGYIQISIGTDTGSGSIQMSADIESAVFGDGMGNPFPSIMESVGGTGDNLFLYPFARDATDEEFNQPYRRPPGSGVQWPDIPLRPRSAP